MANSIIQDKRECWFCKCTNNLEEHHVFYGTSNRKWSDRYGLTVMICRKHHTGSNESVHFSKEMDLMLKQEGQRVYEEKLGTREDFMNTFGRNYL